MGFGRLGDTGLGFKPLGGGDGAAATEASLFAAYETPHDEIGGGDTAAVTLATVFSTDAGCDVVGVRFWCDYDGGDTTGDRSVALYTPTEGDGQVASKAVLAAALTNGWNTVYFDTPYALTASTVLYAAAFYPNGRYGYETGFYSGGDFTNGHITGTGSRYHYNSSIAWPDNDAATTFYVDPIISV